MAVWTQTIPGAAVIDGALFSQDIGFKASAVGVDNYTPYYLYFKDSGSYIAPYWIGAIRSLIHTTDYAYCSVASPFGAQGIPIGVSSFINLVWTDSDQVQQTPGTYIGGTGSPVPAMTVIGTPFDKQFLTTVINVPVSPASPLLIPSAILTLRRGLMLQSSLLNDQLIYVGGSTVTANEASTGGAQLGPGQSFPIDTSLAIPYVITTALRTSGLSQKIIVIEAA